MPFIVPTAEWSHTMTKQVQSTKRAIIGDFQRLLMNFTNILLLVASAILSLNITFKVNLFLLIVPTFLIVYTFIVHTIYSYIIHKTFEQARNNQSLDEIKKYWYITLAMMLFTQYTKSVGCLLGGTQWLVVVLRRFGTIIGDDVIIDDMNSVYDVHLISIDNHTRLSSTSQIQA